ncbi:MAG: alpha/beta hydrolase [Leptolyngbya sp. SIO4C1]|nr:alpha/beta hydrolase [Leptolyngbya sp. SIO4C1]
MSWGHQYIETNQVKLHCVTEGEGELVILLHGLLEFWYSWRYQLPALSKHFKVVVPDLRGYNDSDKPSSGYDLDTLSKDIQGLIQSLGYSRAHIVGHDWGGTIAWHFAQRYPKQLQKLAILSAPHPSLVREAITSNWVQLQRSWYLFSLQVPGLSEWLLQQNLQTFLANLFQREAVRKGAFSKSDTEIYQAALQKPGALQAVTQHARQCFNLREWFLPKRSADRQIDQPTLVLWGEDDSLLSAQTLETLPALLQHPCIKSVPFCGHWAQQEAPQTVNRELTQFLKASA